MKGFKRRMAAFGAAVMMAVSGMAMSGSAESVVYSNVGGYKTTCSAYQATTNSIKISTSVSSSVSVSVSGTAKYSYNGKTYSTGNGNGGTRATTATITKKGGAWKSLSTTHVVVSSSAYVSTAVWSAIGVI